MWADAPDSRLGIYRETTIHSSFTAFPASQAKNFYRNPQAHSLPSTHTQKRSGSALTKRQGRVICWSHYSTLLSPDSSALADHLLLNRRGPGPREWPSAAVTFPVQILLWEACAPVNKFCRQACPCTPSTNPEINGTAPEGDGEVPKSTSLLSSVAHHPSQSSWEHWE